MEPTGSTAPAGVEALSVSHAYDQHEALQELSIAVADGEFCTLLGPSGSGKTTLLRIFAGLLEPSSGEVRIKGRDVTHVSVQDRSIGFVYQHYALFPHLSVADNVGYPLKVRGYDRAERRRLVAEMLEFVDLHGLGDRAPGQLSGGQQQRVAIARALIFKPELLLLDEPLGALDRRLRQQLGAELRRIQKESSTTAVYVTHDQEEALLLSDKVAVIDGGKIQQFGSPLEVYSRPANKFVASFLGDTNVLTGTVADVPPDGGITMIRWAESTFRCSGTIEAERGDPAWFSIRPEDVEVHADRAAAVAAGALVFSHATVEDLIYLGSRYRAFVRLEDDSRLTAELPAAELPPAIGAEVAIGWRDGRPAALKIDH